MITSRAFVSEQVARPHEVSTTTRVGHKIAEGGFWIADSMTRRRLPTNNPEIRNLQSAVGAPTRYRAVVLTSWTGGIVNATNRS